MLRWGIIFLVLSTVIFLVMMLVPIFAPEVLQPLAPIICGEGYTLKQDRYEYRRPGEYSVSVTHTCVGDGEEFSADGAIYLATFGISGVLFALGMWWTIAGAQKRTRRAFGDVLDQGFITVRTGSSDGSQRSVQIGGQSLDPRVRGQLSQITDMLTSVGMAPADIALENAKREDMDIFAGIDDENPLVEKLRQLDEARKAGLISQHEYDQKRQEILDEF